MLSATIWKQADEAFKQNSNLINASYKAFDTLADQAVQVRNQDDDLEVCISRNFVSSEFTMVNSTSFISTDTFQLTPEVNS